MNTKKLLKKYGALLIVACIVVVFYKVFDESIFSAIFTAFIPLIIGSVLAYFLQPLVMSLENRLDKMNNVWLSKRSHIIASIVVFVGFMVIIVISLIYLIPAIIKYTIFFSQNIPSYVADFESTLSGYVSNHSLKGMIVYCERMLINYFENIQWLEPGALFTTISRTGSTMITVLLGLIFCPYILIEAKKLVVIFDKFMSLFISQKAIDLIHDYTYRSHRIFGSFIYGKFIDSLIIGLIALIVLGIIGLDFFPLLAFIIFVTNMIPYFGPFIGAVPVVFIAVLTNGIMPGVYTLVFIFALQQFDGLILGPAILGDTVGISPFWIICSITVFGSLFGFIGMFLGVPFICVIRMLFRDLMAYQKEKKSKQSST